MMSILDNFSNLEDASCFVCELIVGLALLKFILTFINGMKIYFLAKPLGLTVNFKKMGSWAVVTGGTDGIGKGYVLELARLGLNICIISRSQKKLDDVASEVESKCHVQVKTIQADFSHGNEIYENISEGLKDLEVGVLVNNVGISYPYMEYFLEIDNGDEFIDQLIKVNITSMNKMTRIVLPQMLERKRGVIINLSSASGELPMPLITAYSATKAYVNFFSQCLHEEYKSQGIITQVVFPWFVSTNMSHNVRTNLFIPNGLTFARSALATVGVTEQSYGYWPHALQAWVIGLLPSCFYKSQYLKAAKKMRAIALRKKEKNK